MWDYSEKVMDHYRNPRNVGKLDDADLVGEAGALSCGDSLKLYMKVKDGIVTDAKFQTFGCGSAVASASILTEMIIGKPIDEVKNITNKDIANELDGLPPEKMHCSVMGHEALENALKKFYGDDYTIPGATPSAEKVICTCFNVTEQQIIEAIQVNGLKTVDEVTNYTKAGGACGKCKGDIQGILDKELAKQEKPKLSSAQLILKINKVIETIIAPELQKDGGDLELVDIEGSKVYVKLQGRCSSCKNSILTLKSFVETTLKDKVSQEIEVIQL